MNLSHYYDILAAHETHEGQMLHARLSLLCMANSILLVAFFMSAKTPYFYSMHLVLPIIGISFSVIFGYLLWATARGTMAIYNALWKMEEKPDFAHMKDDEIRLFTDVLLREIEPHKYLWKVNFYGAAFSAVPFIAIWVCCLTQTI